MFLYYKFLRVYVWYKPLKLEQLHLETDSLLKACYLLWVLFVKIPMFQYVKKCIWWVYKLFFQKFMCVGIVDGATSIKRLSRDTKALNVVILRTVFSVACALSKPRGDTSFEIIYNSNTELMMLLQMLSREMDCILLREVKCSQYLPNVLVVCDKCDVINILCIL